MNVAEWSHVDALEFALQQISSKIPEYIIRFLRFSEIHTVSPSGCEFFHGDPSFCSCKNVEVAVQFMFRHLTDERAIRGEDLVARGVASEFVEPIATGECLFPYLPPAELLEVRYPNLTVCCSNKGTAGVYSCNVRSSESDEPDGHAPIMDFFHGLPGSLVSGILPVAVLASGWEVVLTY